MLGIFLITVGVLLIILGILIWKKQMVSLLAGYDEKKVIDKQGLAKWVGSNMIIFGAIVVLLSFAIIFSKINTLILLFGIVVIILIMACLIALGCKKYESK